MSQNKPGIATTILAPDPVGEGFIEISPNKTLFVQKLTDTDPLKPEIVEDLGSTDAVFEHFRPTCSVDLVRQDGTTATEDFYFKSLGDFDVKNLITQSSYLKKLNVENEAYIKMRKQLGSNKSLKNVVENPVTKDALINSLRSLIRQLEQAS